MLDKVNVVMDCNQMIMIHHSSIFIFTTFLDIEIIQNFTTAKLYRPNNQQVLPPTLYRNKC